MSQPPAANPAATRSDRPRLGPKKTALLLVAALALGILAWVCASAWGATMLREAYVPALEQQFQRRPGNSELSALLGGRLAEAGQFRKAAQVLEHTAALGDADPLVWLTWAASYAATGDAADAHTVLRLAAAHHINGAAQASDRLDALPAKATPPEQGFAILPSGTASLAHARAAGSFLNGLKEWWGRRHPASSGFATRQHWAEAQPDNPLAVRLWGEALAVNGAYFQAALVLERAVAVDPNSVEARLALGQAMMNLRQAQPALEQFQAVLKLSPGNLKATMGEADGLFRLGHGKDAVAIYERLVRQYPRSVEAWIGLGRVCLSDNPFYARPVEAFATAHKLAPQRTDFLVDYARACRLKYDFATAEQVLRQRLAAEPDDADAHLLLAQVLGSAAARKAEAEAEYRKVLQLTPHQFEAEVGLAELIQAAKPSEAEKLLTDALRQQPAEAKVVAMLAAVLDTEGQHGGAAALRQRAAEINRTMQQIQALQYTIKAQPGNARLRQQLNQLYAAVGLVPAASHSPGAAAGAAAPPAATASDGDQPQAPAAAAATSPR